MRAELRVLPAAPHDHQVHAARLLDDDLRHDSDLERGLDRPLVLLRPLRERVEESAAALAQSASHALLLHRKRDIAPHRPDRLHNGPFDKPDVNDVEPHERGVEDR